MYLVNYVKKFGNYSFKERPFSDVDALVLTTAIFSNYEVVAPSIYTPNVAPTLIKDINRYDMSIVTAGKSLVKKNTSLLPAMKSSKRFGEIGIKYIEKVLIEDIANQFYACTYVIPDVGCFVAFRGTDSTVAGWMENLNLVIYRAVLSQLDAVEYLELVANREKGNLYVGGMSKGGNLTLYASINCKKEVQDRITKAYSFEGNGLGSADYLTSDKFLAVKDRFHLYLPKNSFIGELLYNPKHDVVVKSKGFLFLQHDPHTWKIDGKTGKFVTAEDTTKSSYARHVAIMKFIESTPESDRKLVVTYFTKVIGGLGYTIFDFFLSIKNLPSFIRTQRSFSKEDRKKIKKALKLLLKLLKQAKHSVLI